MTSFCSFAHSMVTAHREDIITLQNPHGFTSMPVTKPAEKVAADSEKSKAVVKPAPAVQAVAKAKNVPCKVHGCWSYPLANTA